jgi:FMN-dependent NADH-azoreductase
VPTLLHIDSSARSTESRSRRISAAFAAAWTAAGPDHVIVRRDLHAQPVPHLADADLHWPDRLRSEGSAPPPEAEALQQELLTELIAADVLLLGAPMYNYNVPSTVKAWIDHIHVPGVTAPFDVASQPLAGRPAVIATSRGGSYAPGSPTEGDDHGTAALRLVLGDALGMDVHVISTDLTLADSVTLLAEHRQDADDQLAAALTAASDLARTLTTARA